MQNPDLAHTNDLLGIPGIEFPEAGEVDLLAGSSVVDDDTVSEETVEVLRKKAAASNPDQLDYIDETVAQMMSAAKREELGLGEDVKTPGELFKHMTPAQKAMVLATYQVTALSGVSINHPIYLDKKAIPDNIHCHWFSPNVVASLGMRGYRRVQATPETRKWAPNARQLGSAKYITHANLVLCAIDSQVKFEQDVLAHQRTNEHLDENDERFRSALRSAAGLIPGLDRATAEELDRTGRGMIATRGYDPDSARQLRENPDAGLTRDLVRGQGE